MEETVKFKSGAMSSDRLPSYWAVHESLERMAAERTDSGTAKYAYHNWLTGILESDIPYIRDRVNHLQKHLKNFMTGDESSDSFESNAQAVAWGAMFVTTLWTLNPSAARAAFYHDPRGEMLNNGTD